MFTFALCRHLALCLLLLLSTTLATAARAAQERSWVLWAQPTTGRNPPIALGVWTTQSACESERSSRQQRVGTDGVLFLTCLPDTVNLRCQ